MWKKWKLHNDYHKNIIPSITENIKTAVDTWKKNKKQQLSENKKTINDSELDAEARLYALRLEKRIYKSQFKENLKENIKEFEDIGLELTVGWVNY